MHKTLSRSHKHSNHSNYDLHGDIEKIKAALFETTMDAKGRAKEIIDQSLENVREKSETVQQNIGSYVSEKPFKAIGLSLLVGWLIGRFTHK